MTDKTPDAKSQEQLIQAIEAFARKTRQAELCEQAIKDLSSFSEYMSSSNILAELNDTASALAKLGDLLKGLVVANADNNSQFCGTIAKVEMLVDGENWQDITEYVGDVAIKAPIDIDVPVDYSNILPRYRLCASQIAPDVVFDRSGTYCLRVGDDGLFHIAGFEEAETE